MLDRVEEPRAAPAWRLDEDELRADQRRRDVRRGEPEGDWRRDMGGEQSADSQRRGSPQGEWLTASARGPQAGGVPGRPRDLSAFLGRQHRSSEPERDAAPPQSGRWFLPEANGRHGEFAQAGVPGLNTGSPSIEPTDSSRDDDTLTRPLPIVLPGATTIPRPAPVEAPRGFFEPAKPENRPASAAGSVEPPSAAYDQPTERPMPKAAEAKLEQLKDLYLTAEAIGERALDKHFDQLSHRQRELIREFFERSEPDSGGQPR